MLLSSFLAFLTASLANAATFQLILDDPETTACETPTTTSVVHTTKPVPTTYPVPTPVPTAPTTPKCSSCPDLDSNLCPPTGTLGIRYGRCYTMTDLGGRQFTRSKGSDAGAKYYYIGGDLPLRNIPFRVCANSTSCDLSQGEYVPEAGKWYLQDQIGFEDKSTADFVGVDKGSGGDIANEWFLVKTDSATKPTQATLIVSFTAKLKCLFGKCAPCVRLESNTSLSPVGRLGILPWIGTNTAAGEALRLIYNIDSCFPIIFQETNCVNRL